MSTKQFTVTHMSLSSGKSERLTVDADGFYIESNFVLFVDNDNKPVAAFPIGVVDSIKSDAVKDAK